MEEEKKKIINMVSENKISAEEAAILLKALQEKKNKQRSRKGRTLHILIEEQGSSKPKLNLAIPVKLAKLGMKFIPNRSSIDAKLGDRDFDFSEINWQEIMELVANDEIGELFHLDIEEEDKVPLSIRIFVD